MVSTLSQNPRHVGLIPALGIILHVFVTPAIYKLTPGLCSPALTSKDSEENMRYAHYQSPILRTVRGTDPPEVEVRNMEGKMMNPTDHLYLQQFWKMIRRNKRRGSDFNVIQHWKHNATILTSLNEISEKLACTFVSNSSLVICLLGFLSIKEWPGCKFLDFSSDGEEDYNSPFSMADLRSRACMTQQSFKHPPTSVLKLLLQLFNTIWKSGVIPTFW